MLFGYMFKRVAKNTLSDKNGFSKYKCINLSQMIPIYSNDID